MVLDVKAMAWASQHQIDTAKLKAARVPIFGKWYFPELPAGVPLVNMETGERRTFPERMLAGEVIWVPEADLRRAKLGPFPAGGPQEAPPPAAASPPPAATAEDAGPLLALSRLPAPSSHARHPAPAAPPALSPVAPAPDQPAPSGVHLPRPSIAPFVLAVGMCLALLGVITNVVIVVVGLLWILVGAVAWIRIGLLELGASAARAPHGSPPSQPRGATDGP